MTAVQPARDAAQEFAAHAARLTYDQLPAEVVERTKLSILDTLAVIIAGSGTPDVAALHRIAAGWGGAPQSTALCFDERLPVYSTVLLNGAMGHQYDFDDTHDANVCHPTTAALCCGLAAAELVGGVDGEQLLCAVALGVDVTARIAGAIDGTLWDFPWVRAPVAGIFGATLAAGKLLGLDEDGLTQALGLALPQAAGTLQCLRTPDSSVRGMRDGLIYKDAIFAAQMAGEGLRGDAQALEGEYGLYRAYFRGEYSRERLLDGLGTRFEGLGVSLKPWPSCRHTHGTLTALLELVERDDFDPQRVSEMVVHVGDGNRRLCEPPAPEFRGRMTLLCNLPFITAVAAAHGDVPLSAFSAEGLSDPRVQAAMSTFRPLHDPAQNRHGTIEPGHVELVFEDGSRWERTADRPLGHPERPMSREQVAAKLHSVLPAARKPIAPADAAALIDAVWACERLDDVSLLPTLTVR
ncbi:MAG TPA: MmgE/PrpD family protein [Solirubrobacteraceae bacterium]|nr:MmgE/PrpD family protein [Solirubrobacteraceae bacterium]